MHEPKPNLSNLKKQAKLIFRQHKERYYPVCARIRKALPRFLDSSDKEILDSSFALHDAQEIIAREYGFNKWEVLKNNKITMNKSNSQNNHNKYLCEAYPQLFVSDVTRTANFYKENLGFEIQYLYGKPPFYGMVKRDNIGLNIRYVCNPPMDQNEKEKEQLISANIPVNGVKSLFLEFKEKEVDIFQSLKSQPWGCVDFIIKDPDGNLLLFSNHPD